MAKFLKPDLVPYFFGSLFNLSVAEAALNGTPEAERLAREIVAATERDELHLGFQLVCYTDLDSGFFSAISQKGSPLPSMVSFYIKCAHRFFGGESLLCVPFQFLIPATPMEGEYLVYRHTFKEPVVSGEEYDETMKSGTDDQRLNMFRLMRSRDGYRTIPGKSYVGMSRRSWSKRYVEHIDSAMSGSSSTLFHEAIREMQGERVLCVHDVVGFGMTKEAAKEYERHLIQTSTLSPKGLNMKIG